jgi:RNA polymerase sigma factor (sigma-70 family)
MHATTLQGILEHLRKLTNPARDRDLSDVDLLERFRLRREEAAFTLLVQRHGPMVLAVCRRVLGDAHEAEDAFQATFLVLIRNAAAIRKQRSLAAWLHGVASRLAHKARKRTLRQRERVGQAFQPDIHDDPGETLATRELRAALDEEIARLPAKYRTPLVLCYLADKTH